ncbi:hypothetical protein GCM10010358_81940 [Streptomyces minutiscleroticus]|uniref:Uncharacterized protein n=1 Tax=Streptomyces minutiscleroticus TaxID=68238 RepID=A0A918P472_9ACTN|nr:hypothetical protein GCM10010358_81940 [Streptomyces minutiscleroticus]
MPPWRRARRRCSTDRSPTRSSFAIAAFFSPRVNRPPARLEPNPLPEPSSVGGHPTTLRLPHTTGPPQGSPRVILSDNAS